MATWANLGSYNEAETPAAMQSHFQLHPYNIDSLVAAIIAHKDRQNAELNHGIESLGHSVGQGIQAYGENQSAKHLAEFENIGLTDQSDQIMTPEQRELLDHMNGRTREQAMGWVGQHQQQDVTNDLNQERMDSLEDRARAAMIHAQVSSPAQRQLTPHQQYIQDQGQTEQMANSLASEEGDIDPAKFANSSDAHGGTFDEDGNWQYYRPQPGEHGEPAQPKQDFISVGGPPKKDNSNVYPANDFERLKKQSQAYMDRRRQSAFGDGKALPVQAAQQTAINSSSQPIAIGTTQPDPATGGNLVWDGHGWIRQ